MERNLHTPGSTDTNTSITLVSLRTYDSAKLIRYNPYSTKYSSNQQFVGLFKAISAKQPRCSGSFFCKYRLCASLETLQNIVSYRIAERAFQLVTGPVS